MKVARTHKEAKYPTKNHETDAGWDFYSLYDYVIKPQTFAIVKTGIAIDLMSEYLWMLLKPKGGSRWLVGGGVIDSGYTGGILVRVINPYNTDIVILKGEAVVQGIILPSVTYNDWDSSGIKHVSLVELDEGRKDKERGAFGGIQNDAYGSSYGTDIDGNQSF